MITQVMFWVALGAIGCAAFAALGIWAAMTDEAYQRQRLASAAQPVPVPSQPVPAGGPVLVPSPAG